MAGYALGILPHHLSKKTQIHQMSPLEPFRLIILCALFPQTVTYSELLLIVGTLFPDVLPLCAVLVPSLHTVFCNFESHAWGSFVVYSYRYIQERV